MTEDNFKKIVETKESLTFIEQQTEIGITAAQSLKKPIELFRLTLQKSLISEIKKTYIWKTEIEAKIELKDFESAIELANQSIFKEEKFKLLVFIARKIKSKGLTIEESILDSIQTLYKQIDVTAYFADDDLAEISSDLLYRYI